MTYLNVFFRLNSLGGQSFNALEFVEHSVFQNMPAIMLLLIFGLFYISFRLSCGKCFKV